MARYTFVERFGTHDHNLLFLGQLIKTVQANQTLMNQAGVQLLGNQINNEQINATLELATPQHQQQQQQQIFQSNNLLQCVQCNMKFSEQTQLQVHMLVHANTEATAQPTNNVCDLCGSMYANTADLNYHILIEHNDDKDMPDKSLDTLTDTFMNANECQMIKTAPIQPLPTHTTTVQQPEFILPITGTNMADSAVSSLSKQYKCEDCGSSFDKLHVLKRHKLSHAGKYKMFNAHVMKINIYI